MGLIPAVRGIAGTIDGTIDAFRAPGREREEARKKKEALDRARQASEDDARGRVQANVAFSDQLQQTQAALPTATAVATAAHDITERGLDNATGRTIQVGAAQGDQVRQTVPVIGQANEGVIGARASGDVTRMQGYTDTVLPAQMRILESTQAHDLATQRNFIGDTPLTTQLLANQRDEREWAAEQSELARRDPLNRLGQVVDLAGRAALAGSIFF